MGVFICSSFSDTVTLAAERLMAGRLVEKIIGRKRSWKKVLFRYLPGGAEEILQLICILYRQNNDDFIIESI
jgi:hypothetical protein